VLATSLGTLTQVVTTGAIVQRVGFHFPSERWLKLEDLTLEKRPPVVPPHATGFIRVGWDGKEAKPQRIKAGVRTGNPKDDLRAVSILEVPLDFVPTLSVGSGNLELASPLHEGKSGTVSFLVWSTTRAGFSLHVREKRDDPCFECLSWSVDPSDYEQLFELKPEVRSARQVRINVYPSRGDHHLDLGPFVRAIELTTDAQPEFLTTVHVTGSMTGNIRVVTEDGREMVNLEDFRASAGVTRKVTVEADSANLDLAIDEKLTSPGYLDVKLDAAPSPAFGKKQWLLTVRVPPDRADGRLPKGSGVTLQTKDATPRRIRIPVVGHASN
jgi:hypothetical protein